LTAQRRAAAKSDQVCAAADAPAALADGLGRKPELELLHSVMQRRDLPLER
jgi:hypothetical protein